MCNLYRLNQTGADIARIFHSSGGDGANYAHMVYPGYPGLVVTEVEVRSMVWGFPLAIKGRNGQPLKPRPVNNARSDKLDSPFWRSSFKSRRCLIPVEAFAEAEGAVGRKTRTWLSVTGEPVFACAGLWRDSAEWGAVYSMVMTDPSAQTAPVHDRMPLILQPADHETWLRGDPAEARLLCVPYPGQMIIERTTEAWVAR